jgi:2-dehydro-3-deoxygalactonokinase
MTGELFDLLTHHSVLRHTTDATAPFDADAFAEGVDAARHSPITGALFQARTRQVLAGKPAAANASFLSGLLVGAELESLTRRECPLLIAASGSLRTAYSTAARILGLEPRLTLLESTPLTAGGQEVLLRRLTVAP